MANGVNVAERYRGYAREGMSESEIQEQADRELKDKQKSDVSAFKGQAAEAKAMDKQQKAQLQANLIKAGVDSAMMAGQAIADSPGMQAKQADRRAARAAKREQRAGTRVDNIVKTNPTNTRKLTRAATRHGKAKARLDAANLRSSKLHEKAYGTPGVLYGKPIEEPETPQPAVKPVLTT